MQVILNDRQDIKTVLIKLLNAMLCFSIKIADSEIKRERERKKKRERESKKGTKLHRNNNNNDWQNLQPRSG